MHDQAVTNVTGVTKLTVRSHMATLVCLHSPSSSSTPLRGPTGSQFEASPFRIVPLVYPLPDLTETPNLKLHMVR
jgi:hypothetical protein